VNKTDIANIAIADHAGEWTADIDSMPGRMGDALRAMWVPTLELALAAHPWKFARTTWRDQAAMPSNPDPDFRYAFRQPADCVRVFELRPQVDFMEWGDDGQGNAAAVIACDEPVVTLIGTRRGVDIGRFSAFFCDYLGHLWGYRICTPVEASEAVRKRCHDDALEALANAKADNGRAGTIRRPAPDTFISGRFAGGWR
jgi:hypothetical protein